MRSALAAVALSGFLVPVHAAGAEEIDRRIGKEPSYKAKSQGYCLLLVGRDEPRRVWLVRDGEDLYVDRNGNGDLADPGERVRFPDLSHLNRRDRPAAEYYARLAPLGKLITSSTASFDYELTFGAMPPKTEKPGSFKLYAEDDRAMPRPKPPARSASSGLIAIASGVLAESPARAPIIHLGGPLSMNLSSPKDAVLVRGARPPDLYLQVGTFLTENGHRHLTQWEVPEGVHPVADVVFPGPPGGMPITARYVLEKRC